MLKQAEQYLSGLVQSARRNMERMAEVVPGTDAQALHHFLSNSPWDARAVMDQVACDLDELLGGESDSCLVIDESCIAKKGTKSVGVARQWMGTEGKTDNCQVAVFSALVRGRWVGLADAELYLPKEWVEDPARCEAAGVPAERQVLETKPQLALEMVRRARANRVRFSWVTADANYGQDGGFLRALDDEGEIFVADVHRDQRIFLEEPPAGKTRSGGQQQVQSLRVDAWATGQPAEAWKKLWVRDSTRGSLRVETLHRRIWVRRHRDTAARCWHLIITREPGAPETAKYSLSNAPAETSAQRLAHMQRQRYWVERIFQDAKNEAGLDEYQARGWRAWNHHVALVMMAMLFLLRERLEHTEDLPLLSARDVKILLARVLPRRDLDLDEVIRQMQVRHKRRQSAIDSAYRIQRRRGKSRAAKVTK